MPRSDIVERLVRSERLGQRLHKQIELDFAGKDARESSILCVVQEARRKQQSVLFVVNKVSSSNI